MQPGSEPCHIQQGHDVLVYISERQRSFHFFVSRYDQPESIVINRELLFGKNSCYNDNMKKVFSQQKKLSICARLTLRKRDVVFLTLLLCCAIIMMHFICENE